MATMPQRKETCLQSIESIYDQADIIRIYLNNFEEIPKELIDDKIITYRGEDLRSSGKLFWALNKNEYYFCIDDDIYYPETYADDMVNKLNEFNDDIVVSLHGKEMKSGKISSYFGDIKNRYEFWKNVEKDSFVDVIGNGVSCFNTNKLRISYKSFKYLYMDDIMVSIAARTQGLKGLIMAHDENYTKKLDQIGKTLYREYCENDKTQTEMMNSIKWK